MLLDTLGEPVAQRRRAAEQERDDGAVEVVRDGAPSRRAGGDPARESAEAGHAWRLAERLTRQHRLPSMAVFTPERWLAIDGLGEPAAARLAAAFELGRRATADDDATSRPPAHTPRLAWELVRDIGTRRREHLVGLYLDAQSRLLHRETISIGALNTTRAHPREFLRPAIEQLAAAFILAHNHPSGSPEASSEDVAFTRAARRAAAMMGFELFDHLIVTRNRYTSLREQGLFDEEPS